MNGRRDGDRGCVGGHPGERGDLTRAQRSWAGGELGNLWQGKGCDLDLHGLRSTGAARSGGDRAISGGLRRRILHAARSFRAGGDCARGRSGSRGDRHRSGVAGLPTQGDALPGVDGGRARRERDGRRGRHVGGAAAAPARASAQNGQKQSSAVNQTKQLIFKGSLESFPVRTRAQSQMPSPGVLLSRECRLGIEKVGGDSAGSSITRGCTRAEGLAEPFCILAGAASAHGKCFEGKVERHC